MSTSLAVEVLTERRQKIVGMKEKTIERYDKEVAEIEAAILQLTGKRSWEEVPAEKYDDENPDYIKQSIED